MTWILFIYSFYFKPNDKSVDLLFYPLVMHSVKKLEKLLFTSSFSFDFKFDDLKIISNLHCLYNDKGQMVIWILWLRKERKIAMTSHGMFSSSLCKYPQILRWQHWKTWKHKHTADVFEPFDHLCRSAVTIQCKHALKAFFFFWLTACLVSLWSDPDKQEIWVTQILLVL